MKKVKVNYLFNSGFAVETDNYIMVFDYFLDSSEDGGRSIESGVINPAALKTGKKVIVFSSHSHADHFNPVIFDWSKTLPDIQYVLSSDINTKVKGNRVNSMSAYEQIQLDGVLVKAFGSTDLGVSFLVEADDIRIFHAGDLNWWYWWDDTEEEFKAGESAFKGEIKRIEGEVIDVAFFPVDPRLRHNYDLGGKYFINKLKPKYFFPMHFGRDYETTYKFRDEVKECETKVLSINRRGQEFNIFM